MAERWPDVQAASERAGDPVCLVALDQRQEGAYVERPVVERLGGVSVSLGKKKALG